VILNGLKPDTTEATMLVMSDVDDVFLPKPTDLLLNLVESRNAIENLLNRIPNMFADNTVIGGAIGPGLQAGHKMIVSVISRSGSFELMSPPSLILVVKSWFWRPVCQLWEREPLRIEKTRRFLVLPR
jgi:hypothetical protein